MSDGTRETRGDLIHKLEDLLQRRGNATARANTSSNDGDSLGTRANWVLANALNAEIEDVMARLRDFGTSSSDE